MTTLKDQHRSKTRGSDENTAVTVIRYTLISLAGLSALWRLFYHPHENIALLLPGVSLSPLVAAGLILWIFCVWAGLMALIAKWQPGLFHLVHAVTGMEGVAFLGFFWLIFLYNSPTAEVVFAMVLGLMFVSSWAHLLLSRKSMIMVR